VIIIITDGKASDQHNALHETAALKRQGVQIIGIAAGTKLNVDQFIDNLYAIVADKSLVFTTSFHGLDTIVDKITKSTCDMGKLTFRAGVARVRQS
jgi:predicted GTPase